MSSSSSISISSIDYLSYDTNDEIFSFVHNMQQVVAQHFAKKKKKKKTVVYRDREAACKQLEADYFTSNPTYDPSFFRCRFRMRKDLVMRIYSALEANVRYFRQRKDATERYGLTAVQNCTLAVRQLATGGATDVFNEYLKIRDNTGRLCLKKFCRAIIELFGDEYLRRPNDRDVARLLRMHEERHDFSRMLESLECMHWAWKNRSKAWAAAYMRGDQGELMLILEAVASTDLYMDLACLFGIAGSNNDINVLNQSPLFADVIEDRALPVTFPAKKKKLRQGILFD